MYRTSAPFFVEMIHQKIYEARRLYVGENIRCVFFWFAPLTKPVA
ncbi:hypothetical protein ALO84_102464 [Pseudomonas syringae pv. maculicola]|uniref:Uncharacterized protein n=1 Tax=Pseudomonas syringae pv. maculicola TaxID=59511 RepID=A0A0P9TJP4_PSEYM|nr:Unknown protein sequence [Pseudomonas syringae pv. maculicola str. M6]KPX74993.1 hypothetical protein ALO84_102464 [Pseudomonas syringae pv. maculicola]RMV33161.1 hypothetical protein ALP13_104083 [Pseudomonas syringae pv. maculicola]